MLAFKLVCSVTGLEGKLGLCLVRQVFPLCLFKVLQCRVKSERANADRLRAYDHKISTKRFLYPTSTVCVIIIRALLYFHSVIASSSYPAYLRLAYIHQTNLLLLFFPAYHIGNLGRFCNFRHFTINSMAQLVSV